MTYREFKSLEIGNLVMSICNCRTKQVGVVDDIFGDTSVSVKFNQERSMCFAYSELTLVPKKLEAFV
jgi:hypothetical protein